MPHFHDDGSGRKSEQIDEERLRQMSQDQDDTKKRVEDERTRQKELKKDGKDNQ